MDALLAEIVPDGIGLATAEVGDHTGELFPAEAAYVARAVDSRRREYATGRHLARRALGQVGGSFGPLITRQNRAPAWPDGFIGSITHTGEHAAAVAARGVDFAGIGIDIEAIGRVTQRLVPRIATPAEQAALAEATDPSLMMALLFSAKEAWYKCQHPLTDRFLGFEDAELSIDWAAGTFHVRTLVVTDSIAAAASAQGRFAWNDVLIAAIITIPTVTRPNSPPSTHSPR